MAKGIIYVMSTAVDGLIKIGKTGSDNFSQRMTYRESNGYRNVSGLKRQFAIELSGYEEKERLLDSLFSRSRVSNTELFSLNINEVIQLLSSFEGKIVYPAQENKARIFENATEAVETALIPDGTYTLDVKQKDNRRVHAEMIVKNGKLTVKKGANLGAVRNLTVESWKAARNDLQEKDGVSRKDFSATTPSMASAVVLGRSSNGWTTWKDKNNNHIDIYRKKNDSDNDDD